MKRTVNRLAGAFFVLMTVSVTFPGLTPFNRIHPMVFGLPFVLAFFLGWILASLFVFYILYRVHSR